MIAGAKEPKAADDRIRFFASPAAAPAITESGMEPMTGAERK